MAVVSANDDCALGGISVGSVALLAALGERFGDGSMRSYPGGNGSEHRRLHEITARECHESSRL